MKTHNTLFNCTCAALVALIIVTAGAGSLGVVWMRQQITRSANRIKTVERDLAESNRKNAYLAAKVAQAHNPEFLRARVGTALAAPKDKQVVWVRPTHNVPRRNNGDLTAPFAVSFELALLDAERPNAN